MFTYSFAVLSFKFVLKEEIFCLKGNFLIFFIILSSFTARSVFAELVAYYPMTAGSYTVEITYRENGTQLNAFLCSNNTDFDTNIFAPLFIT